MSIYKLVQIQCDGPSCFEFVDLHMSLAQAKRDAAANGWHIGRGGDPDLCPQCNPEAETPTGPTGVNRE